MSLKPISLVSKQGALDSIGNGIIFLLLLITKEVHAQPAKTGFISEWTFLAPSFIVCIRRRLYYSSFCLLQFGVIELRLNPSWIHQITQLSEEERESSLSVWVFKMPQEDLLPQTMKLPGIFTLLRGAFWLVPVLCKVARLFLNWKLRLLFPRTHCRDSWWMIGSPGLLSILVNEKGETRLTCHLWGLGCRLLTDLSAHFSSLWRKEMV